MFQWTEVSSKLKSWVVFESSSWLTLRPINKCSCQFCLLIISQKPCGNHIFLEISAEMETWAKAVYSEFFFFFPCEIYREKEEELDSKSHQVVWQTWQGREFQTIRQIFQNQPSRELRTRNWPLYESHIGKKWPDSSAVSCQPLAGAGQDKHDLNSNASVHFEDYSWKGLANCTSWSWISSSFLKTNPSDTSMVSTYSSSFYSCSNGFNPDLHWDDYNGFLAGPLDSVLAHLQSILHNVTTSFQRSNVKK